jgi:hypothetical protein
MAFKLSNGEFEQQLSDITTNINFAAEWTLSAIEDEEDSMGDHGDLPICRKNL